MELVCLACNSTFLDTTPVKWRIVRKNETGSPESFCAIGSKYRTSVRTEFEACEIEKELSKTGNKEKSIKILWRIAPAI